jgi:hypothetical protein
LPARPFDPLFEATQRSEDTIASRTAEEIDLLGRDQAFPKNVEQAPEGGCPRALRPPGACGTFQRLLDVPGQFLVQLLAHSPELLDERTVRPRIHVVGREDTRITSGRPHLGLEPLEILAGISRIGERIDGLLQRNRADLLKPPPRRDPEVRRVRRELVDEQQPATAGWRSRCDRQPISF